MRTETFDIVVVGGGGAGLAALMEWSMDHVPAAILRPFLTQFLRTALAPSPRGKFAAGPFIALGPVRSVFVHAEGGLAVDSQHRVLAADNRPLPGLYAAGSSGQGGLLLKGHGHHLAWAFVSGRRAGRFAAISNEGAETK